MPWYRDSLHWSDGQSMLYDVRIVEYELIPTSADLDATATITADGTVIPLIKATLSGEATFDAYGTGPFYPIAAPAVVSSYYEIDPAKASQIGPFYDRFKDRYYLVLHDPIADSAVIHYANDREGTWTAITTTTMPLDGGRYCVCMGEAEFEQRLFVVVQELKDTGAGTSPIKLWEYDGSTDTFNQTALVIDSASDANAACVSAAMRKNTVSSNWELVIAYNGESELYLSLERERVHAAIYNVTTQTVTSTAIVLDDSAFSPIYDWQNPSICPDPNYTDTYVFFMTGPEETAPSDVSNGIWGRTFYNDNTLQDWPFIALFGITGIGPGLGQNELLPPMSNAVSFYDNPDTYAQVGICVLQTYFAAFTAKADGTNQIFQNGTELTDYIVPISESDPYENPGNYLLLTSPQLSTEYDYNSNANAISKRYALYSPKDNKIVRDRAQGAGQFVGGAWLQDSETIGSGVTGAISKNGTQMLLSYAYNDGGDVMYDEFGLTTQGFAQMWLANPHSNLKLSASIDLNGTRQLASRTVAAAGTASVPTWGGTHIPYDPIKPAVVNQSATASLGASASRVVSAKLTAGGVAEISLLGGFDVGAPMAVTATSSVTFGGNNLTSVQGVGTVEVIVVRGTGDSPGEDIVDGLLTEDIVALSRGRAELDGAQSNQTVTLTIVYKSGIRQGQLVEVFDRLVGAAWRGKVVGIQHTMEKISGPRATSQLEVERVTDFYV